MSIKGHVRAVTSEEAFSLQVFRMTLQAAEPPHPGAAEDHALDVPVIDGWVQINLPVIRVPTPAEERAFFAHLARFVADTRGHGSLARWYFVHKAPGLRLRLHVRRAADPRDEATGHLIAAAYAALTAPAWPWAGVPAFDSYFEQRELMAGLHDDTAIDLMCQSADARVAAAADGSVGDVPVWAAFTVGFLHRYLPDTWWVWEALGRFMRLRGANISDTNDDPQALADPRAFLASLPRATPTPGFAASVALLTCLNYIFNQWGLNAATLRQVLSLARDLTRPEITHP